MRCDLRGAFGVPGASGKVRRGSIPFVAIGKSMRCDLRGAFGVPGASGKVRSARTKVWPFFFGVPAPCLAPGRRPPLPPRLLAMAAARGADLYPGVE